LHRVTDVLELGGQPLFVEYFLKLKLSRLHSIIVEQKTTSFNFLPFY